MKIKVIGLDGMERVLDVLSFEFRRNQDSNWLKIKFKNGAEARIRNVCVVKTVD